MAMDPDSGRVCCYRCGVDLVKVTAPTHSLNNHQYCEPCALIIADRRFPELARVIRKARIRRVQMNRHFAQVDVGRADR